MSKLRTASSHFPDSVPRVCCLVGPQTCTSLSFCWADSWPISLFVLLSLPPRELRRWQCHLGQALTFEQAHGIWLMFRSSVKQEWEPQSLKKI